MQVRLINKYLIHTEMLFFIFALDRTIKGFLFGIFIQKYTQQFIIWSNFLFRTYFFCIFSNAFYFVTLICLINSLFFRQQKILIHKMNWGYKFFQLKFWKAAKNSYCANCFIVFSDFWQFARACLEPPWEKEPPGFHFRQEGENTKF